MNKEMKLEILQLMGQTPFSGSATVSRHANAVSLAIRDNDETAFAVNLLYWLENLNLTLLGFVEEYNLATMELKSIKADLRAAGRLIKLMGGER